MTKKLMSSVVPLIAVAAFAVMPAMAQAETKSYGTCATGTPETKPPCPTGQKFTAFTENEHIAVYGKKVSTTFVLENEAKTADITCTTLQAGGLFWNVTGDIGKSHVILNFDGCTGTGLLAGCSINPLTNHEIEGVVTDEVLTETTVKVTIESGFNVKCGTTELGNVTGSVTGTQSGSVLKFKEAKGLTFAGEPSTITGEVEFITSETGKKVYIN
ncbi:MAG: hypothetical protein ACLQBY_16930 [Solirubrobacteraceae bacterium]